MKKALKLILFPVLVIIVAFTVKDTKKKVVVIDAAHGGTESGVTYDSIQEKDIVLSVSKYLTDLSDEAVVFVPLRKDDSYMPLDLRLEKIDSIKPDMVLSLHLASDADMNKHGAVAHVYKNDVYNNSKKIAEHLLTKLDEGDFTVNEEVQESDFYLLKNVKNVPSVILEMGYVSNTQDRAVVTKEQKEKQIATIIANAVKF